MTVISPNKRPGTPAGVRAISRGSSEATPPVMRSAVEADPGGVAAALSAKSTLHSGQAIPAKISRHFEAGRISCAAGTPAGVRPRSQFKTGGVASLNLRLIAATPAGVERYTNTRRCAVELIAGWQALSMRNGPVRKWGTRNCLRLVEIVVLTYPSFVPEIQGAADNTRTPEMSHRVQDSPRIFRRRLPKLVVVLFISGFLSVAFSSSSARHPCLIRV